MSTSSHVSRTWTAVIAIIFLIPALVLFFMWISIGMRYADIGDGEKMDTYISYFPGWLSNINIIHTISIVCCFVSIALATRSFKKHLLSIRILMLLTVLAAIFVLLFDTYQII